MSNSQEQISEMCDSLKEFLIEKNKRYGNSALSPMDVFSKQGGQIEVRLDDKLSRIKNSVVLRKNDVIDMTGYLILLCVREGWFDLKELID